MPSIKSDSVMRVSSQGYSSRGFFSRMISSKASLASLDVLDQELNAMLTELQLELGVTALERQAEATAEQRAAFARMERANAELYAKLEALGGLQVCVHACVHLCVRAFVCLCLLFVCICGVCAFVSVCECVFVCV